MDTFDYQAFLIRYPEFASISNSVLTSYFSEAVVFLNKRIQCNRVVYLNMITAHIAALFSGVNGNQPTGVVGRVSQATEGSVSASLEYAKVTSDLQAWFNQTTYGAEYWALSAGYRTAFYIPGHSEARYTYGGYI